MSPMLVRALVSVICTHLSFIVRSAVMVLIWRSEYLMSDAFRFILAFRLAGTTMRDGAVTTSVESMIIFFSNSSSLISS